MLDNVSPPFYRVGFLLCDFIDIDKFEPIRLILRIRPKLATQAHSNNGCALFIIHTSETVLKQLKMQSEEKVKKLSENFGGFRKLSYLCNVIKKHVQHLKRY